MVKAIFCAVSLWFALFFGVASAQSIEILEPSGESRAEWRPTVSGTLDPIPNDPTVWVVVKPHTVGQFYVQPAAAVRGDGSWDTVIYLGEASTSGVNFDVMAVADASTDLSEGLVLTGWPEARYRSVVILLKR